jgi:hypothetical protein
MADLVVNLGDITHTYRHEQESFEVRQLTGKYRSITSAFAPFGTIRDPRPRLCRCGHLGADGSKKRRDRNHAGTAHQRRIIPAIFIFSPECFYKSLP